MNKKILSSLLLSVSLLFFASCQKEEAKKPNNMKSNNIRKPTLREINQDRCPSCPDQNCCPSTDKCEEPKDKCCTNDKADNSVSSPQLDQDSYQDVSADITSDDLIDEDNSEISSFESSVEED